MNRRTLSTIGVILMAAAAGVLVAALLINWVVVGVHTTGAEAVDFKIPVPLPLIQSVLAFIPSSTFETAAIPPDVTAQREAILTSLRALADAPDATFVRVTSPDARVTIAKEGHSLHVNVEGEDGAVACVIPIDGTLKALERWDWKSIDPRIATRILASAHRGPLVTVDQPGAHVVISVW
jgi:hypothetical protein